MQEGKTKLNWRDWLIMAGIFLLAAGIRAYPEIKVGYWPIGYDTFNSYLPDLTRFDGNFARWVFNSDLFYLLVWPFIKLFHLDVSLALKIAGSVLYGGLTAVLYAFCRKYFNWSKILCFIIAIIFMIQLAALRISWDLFRNMLALIFLFPAFYFLYTNHKVRNIIFLLIFSILIILSNPLIAGLWFVLVAAWLSHKLWQKDYRNFWLIAMSILPAVVLFILTIKTSGANSFGGHVFYQSESERFLSYFTFYTQKMSYDALVSTIWQTFWFYFQFLITPALYGFWLLRKNLLLSVLTLWLLLGSFSSVIFGGFGLFVWDRWMFMLVIPFSIYAVYGLWDLGGKIIQIKIFQIKWAKGILIGLATVFWVSVVGFFVWYNWPFVNTPSKDAKPPYLNKQINAWLPPSMQNNAVGFENINDILECIDYLNQQAPNDSIVAVDHRYRGIFLLKFDYSKRYLYTYAWSSKLNNDTLKNLRQQNIGTVYTIWGSSSFITNFKRAFVSGRLGVYREKKVYQNDQASTPEN